MPDEKLEPHNLRLPPAILSAVDSIRLKISPSDGLAHCSRADVLRRAILIGLPQLGRQYGIEVQL